MTTQARTSSRGAWRDQARKASKAALALLAATQASWAWAQGRVNDLPGGPAVNQLDLHPAVTKIAAEQHWLHVVTMGMIVVIFVAVFGVMFYSILRHRKSVGHKAATFHESLTVEIAWTVVPFILVVILGALATRTVVAQKDTSNADLTIKATGYQWKWGYDYIKGEGEGISMLSALDLAHRQASDSGKPAPVDDYLLKVDHPLVVPVDRKVRIVTTAADVIHSWMVPSLGVKQDAIPGFVRDTWFRAEKVGDYYGQCAELCGKEHAYMPIHVRVLSQADYSAWAAAELKKVAAAADDPNKVWTLEAFHARGEKIYNANCAACHRPDGKGAGPIKALDGSQIVLHQPALQIDRVLNGFNNGAMPPWKQLSDTDIAAVITYTKNAWGNKTGHVVQPADVAAVRAGQTPKLLTAPESAAAATAAPAASAAPAAAPVAAAPAAWPVAVLFSVGKAGLDADARAAVEKAIAALKADPAVKVQISGYVDASGNAAQNAELAKQRAFTVRDALKAAGIAEDRIVLQKPGDIVAGSPDKDQARRVEIKPAA